MPQAILFDLDCTLTDRPQSIVHYAERFYQDFVNSLRRTTAQTIAAVIQTADGAGYRPREAVFADLVATLPWETPPALSAIRTHWQTWFPRAVVARPGLHATLATLHALHLRLGLITNGSTRSQEAKIEALQIRPWLSTVVISEAVQMKKPDPRIFAHALAEVHCGASQAWFVGDHPVNDVLGAAAAGLQPIWLTGVHPWPVEHPEPQWHIAALPELVPLVQRQHDYTP